VSMPALLLGVAVLPSPAWALTLTVQNVDGGAAISDFSYIVNVDNTGDPSHRDPAMHPGVHPMASYSPIVAAGDETTPAIVGADGNPLPAGNCGPDGNDACRYLISVRADGYKLWGQHFRLPGAPATLVVELQPEPLPLSKLVVKVFHDFAPPDGFPNFQEVGAVGPPPELGLDGFHIVVKDVIGEVTVDFDGNPICGDGVCLTDVNGDLTIENLPFGKYLVCAIPPDGNPNEFVQTTTFEGGEEKCIDAWLEEGSDGHGAPGEILVEAGVFTAFFFGFTTNLTDLSCSANCESIQGTVRNFVTFPPFEQITFGEPVKLPWVALTDIGNTDRQVARVRGNASGFFNFPSVPPGSYQVAIWDDALEYIMIFYTVNVDPLDGISNNVPGGDPNGNVGVFRWFGWLSGFVFNDVNQDGIRVGGEAGIGNIDLYIKNRDGSLNAGTFTNNTNTPKKGYYEFTQARGPLGRFQVGEVGAGRFKWTTKSLHDEQFANYNLLDPSPTPIPGDLGGDLLINQLSWEGKRSIVDWGKVPWLSGQNGGIAGATFYATTRNEFDARLA
ncbi:MAG: SdrD B-like domain-containing protein, partial [Dongiaceae bacterium]